MNEIISTNGMKYQEFKEKLGKELREHVEGFVRIGYLLKVARDTKILEESRYKNMEEFAKSEYGLTKDVVSRYIAINDRFSVDGYSEQLKDEFKLYGVAKLSEMLTLPDEIIESIDPQMTRKEIQEIKKEVKTEKEISDIEVYLEEKQKIGTNLGYIENVFFTYFSDKVSDFIRMQEDLQSKNFLEVLAPSGVAMLSTRISGIGKILISIRGLDYDINVINARTNEKENIPWIQLKEIIADITEPMQEIIDAAQAEQETAEPEQKSQTEKEPECEVEKKKEESKEAFEPEEKQKEEQKEDFEPVQQLTEKEDTKKEEKSVEVAPVQPKTFMNQPEQEGRYIEILLRSESKVRMIMNEILTYDIINEREARFKVGDTVCFSYYNRQQDSIPESVNVRIKHITKGEETSGIENGYAVIGFEKVTGE